MNRVNVRLGWYGLLGITGVVLFLLPLFGVMDEFWSGMGAGLVGVSVVRLLQIARYKKDEDYAERVSVSNGDERNRYVAEKARSRGFYYSLLLECIGVILLRVFEQPEYSTLLGLLVCAQLLIYWGTWFYLRKKY